ILLDFMAMSLCDLMPLNPKSSNLRPSRRPLPELVYFIQKVTYQARINCRTALVALIYLNRAKAALPKNAVGSDDTCHRMLLGALLLASKFLQDTTWYTVKDEPLTNRRLHDVCCGIFSLDDIHQLERAFLKLIRYECWVDDKDVDAFVLHHRADFFL
ncbi:uncharacterized protein BYT42DRAFT_494166, partial [Radiomyces spectabilis]|uniref:uncharacterized protein n=1 Tax=Radiomyces spectabilis TaxID=64574 RepID=UPI00221ED78F